MADQPVVPVIIVDGEGTEHEFPPGFDPKRAADIVRSRGPWTDRYPRTAQMIKGGLSALPAGGALVGGVAATPETLGLGTAAGAGIGAMVGSSAQQFLEKLIGLRKEYSPNEATAQGLVTAGSTAALGAAPAVMKALNPKALLGDVAKAGTISPGKLGAQVIKRTAAELAGPEAGGPILKRPSWQAAEAPPPGSPSSFPSPAGYNFIDNAISAAKTNPETAPGLNLLGHQLGTNPDNLAFERFAGQDHMFEGRKLGDILSSPGSADYLARESQANAPIARKVLGDAVKPSPSIQLREPPTGPPAAPQFTIKPPGEAPNSVNLRPPKPSGQPIEAWHAKAAPGSKNAQAAQSLHIAEGQPDPLRNAGYHPRTPARPDPELEALLRSLRFRGGQ